MVLSIKKNHHKQKLVKNEIIQFETTKQKHHTKRI